MLRPDALLSTSNNTSTNHARTAETPLKPPVTIFTPDDTEEVAERTPIEFARAWLDTVVPREDGTINLTTTCTRLMDDFGLSKAEAASLLAEYDTDAVITVLDNVESSITIAGGPSKSALAGPPVEICVNRGMFDTSYDSIMRLLPSIRGLYYTGKCLTKYASGTRKLKYTITMSNKKETKYLGQAGYIDLVDDSWLLVNLPRYATFFKLSKKKGKEVTTLADPPPVPIRAVLKSSIFPGVKELTTIVKAPYLNANLVPQAPGYDKYTSTMVLYNYKVGPLPASPTREDAMWSAAAILKYVSQFPFETDADRAVWLAALLTSIQRPMIRGNTIGFAFIGNKPAIGKGLLVDILITVTTGDRASTTHYPIDINEACKLKISLALSGASYVFYDNLTNGSTYGNGSLDSAITNPKMKDRILGGNANTEDIAFAPVWFLAGNNITPEADAWRRWLVCNLISEFLNPETRDDIVDKDILNTVKNARADIIYNALLILKAYALAVEADKHPKWAPLGSFYEWDEMIRGAVWYATGVDCDTGRKTIATESPDYLNRVELLEVLTSVFGTRDFTIDDVWAMANETDKVNPFVWTHPEIRAALIRYSKSPNNLPNRSMVGVHIGALSKSATACGNNIKTLIKHVDKHRNKISYNVEVRQLNISEPTA